MNALKYFFSAPAIAVTGMLLACIPAQDPKDNIVAPALLGITYAAAPAESIQTQILDSLFPQTGPEALQSGEREHLEYRMHERYNAGFYEPMVQPHIALDMLDIMDLAAEDGVSLRSLNQDFLAEARRIKDTAPTKIIWNLRFVAANSVVMTEEMLLEDGFWKNGALDRKQFEDSKAFMMDVYIEMTEELKRREAL